MRVEELGARSHSSVTRRPSRLCDRPWLVRIVPWDSGLDCANRSETTCTLVCTFSMWIWRNCHGLSSPMRWRAGLVREASRALCGAAKYGILGRAFRCSETSARCVRAFGRSGVQAFRISSCVAILARSRPLPHARRPRDFSCVTIRPVARGQRVLVPSRWQ